MGGKKASVTNALLLAKEVDSISIFTYADPESYPQE
jgi:hypothetical protein